MNDYELYKRLLKYNFTNINLGHVFADVTELKEEDPSYIPRLDNTLSGIDHFEIYDNWYLPFDISTYFGMIPIHDEHFVFGIIFNQPEEKKIGSPLSFKIIIEKIGTYCGEIRLIKTDEITNSVFEKGKFILVRSPPTTIECKYSIVGCMQKCFLQHPQTKEIITKIFTDEENQCSDLLADILSFVLIGFAYFTEIVIHTDKFVVEEKIAHRKKGKIRQKPGSPTLYRVIDIRTLRTKYFNSTSYGTNGTRECLWRRRHTRTFRSDFYTNRKGDTIMIEPIWIGPSESFDPGTNRLYKVRLDIG